MPSIEDLLLRNEEMMQQTFAPAVDEIDRERRFPRENIDALGRSGLLGLLVPSEYGGAGAGMPEMSRVLDQMAQCCPSTAMVALMHCCGTAIAVSKRSGKLQHDLLPAIARGTHLTTLAFSEAGSGTDTSTRPSAS
jgi:isovaleryl-CoA dehydrogenase